MKLSEKENFCFILCTFFNKNKIYSKNYHNNSHLDNHITFRLILSFYSYSHLIILKFIHIVPKKAKKLTIWEKILKKKNSNFFWLKSCFFSFVFRFVNTTNAFQTLQTTFQREQTTITPLLNIFFEKRILLFFKIKTKINKINKINNNNKSQCQSQLPHSSKTPSFYPQLFTQYISQTNRAHDNNSRTN
jgi:hypothetical protein